MSERVAASGSPQIVDLALALGTTGGSDLVCTLDGGTDAMRERITQWQDVVGRDGTRSDVEA